VVAGEYQTKRSVAIRYFRECAEVFKMVSDYSMVDRCGCELAAMKF
jgi:hypothetical protein